MRRALQFVASSQGKTPAEEVEFHTRWFEMVEHYSERLFTDDRDKLVAMAGVASFVQAESRRRATDDRILTYAAGLWHASGGQTPSLLLPLSLLWEVVRVSRPLKPGGVRPAGRRVPSWSWGSIDGKISHRLKVATVPENRVGSMSAEAMAEEFRASWDAITSLVSYLAIKPLHTIGDTVHSATLSMMCQLHQLKPDPEVSVIHDTLEELPSGSIMHLPVLEFVNERVYPLTRRPQVHGILVVRAQASATAAVGDGNIGAENATSCYRRVGYFWMQTQAGVLPAPVAYERVELV